MVLGLVPVIQLPRILFRGATNVVVPDGRKLKIDVPSVEDVFNDGPPDGKQWRVNIDLTIEETDS